MSLLRDLARKSVLKSVPKSVLKSPRLRRIVKPRGQLGKIINEDLIMDNLSYWYIDTRVPHWLLKLLRTYPSQPVLSDEITKNLLVQTIKSPKAKAYLKDYFKNKYSEEMIEKLVAPLNRKFKMKRSSSGDSPRFKRTKFNNAETWILQDPVSIFDMYTLYDDESEAFKEESKGDLPLVNDDYIRRFKNFRKNVIKTFNVVYDGSYWCKPSEGIINAEWTLKDEFNRIQIFDSVDFKNDLYYILSYRALTNNYPYGPKYGDLSGPQQVHMHLSIRDFNFGDPNVQKEYFRYLNRVWVEDYQDTKSREFNPDLDEWLILPGHLNSISYFNEFPPRYNLEEENLPKSIELEPFIWDEDEDEYFEGRYCILNFIPSHPLENNGTYPLHIEYRGLKPIRYQRGVNNARLVAEELTIYFKNVANFFSSLIQTTLYNFIPWLESQQWFSNNHLLEYYKASQANPVFRIGLEIETCIDVKQMTV